MGKTGIKSLLSLMMAVVLIFTLLPIYPAQAADATNLKITNLSNLDKSPTTNSSGKTDIQGTFQGVTPSSITYKVESIVDEKVVYTSNGGDAQPDTSDGKTFTFFGVALRSGLNKITVTATSSGGATIGASAYVKYVSAPNVSSVKVGGQEVSKNEPLITTTENASITIQAPNATEVKVNGNTMFGGGSDTFFVTLKLQPGVNKLDIVARTATSTFTDARDLVFFNGKAQIYDVSIGGKPVDNAATLSGPLSGSVKGKVILPIPNGKQGDIPSQQDVKVILNQSNGTDRDPVDKIDTQINLVKTIDTTMVLYDFSTTLSTPLNSGKFEFSLNKAELPWSFSTGINFSVRNEDEAYIKNVYQLYSPSVKDEAVTSYGSKTPVSSTVPELPFWLAVEVGGTGAASATVQLNTSGDGVGNNWYKTYTDQSGTQYRIFSVNKLASGSQTLTVSLSGGDSKVIPLTYESAPYIEVLNIYNEQVFDGPNALFESGRTINGHLVNFPVDSKIQVEFNGQTRNDVEVNSVTNDFSIDNTNSFSLKLVAGPNTLKISGTANGRAVSTQIVVYLLETTDLDVIDFSPLPSDKTEPDDKIFVPGAKGEYTTSETKMNVRFRIWDPRNKVAASADEVSIQVDGGKDDLKQRLTYENGAWGADKDRSLLDVTPPKGDGMFLVRGLRVPTSGKSGDVKITVSVRKGTVTNSQTITVTRELAAYRILSPKLPNESVITQNFLDVSIEAEGADSIAVGKEAMVKDGSPDSDIFRLRLTGLKAGKNTVKFTITTGKNKKTGSFVVNYSQENVVGAQYSTKLPAGGKIKLFKGDLQVSLPKGTLLTPVDAIANTTPLKISLFDNQELVAGIANPVDGRTVTVYNQVKEKGSNNLYLDGQLNTISASGDMSALLTPKLHFGYASDLYWLDAGYFNAASPLADDYKSEPGNQPYKLPLSGNNPRQATQWLKPTQQGTITIKYDPNLVNASAGNIGIWKLNGAEWVNVGGKVNSSAKTVTAPFDGFGYYAVFGLRYSYGDIIAQKTARDDIEKVISRGVMISKDANEFGTNEPISRGEFATMLVRMLNIPLDYDENISKRTFDDVGPVITNYMDYRYIETAVRKGIIRGTAPRVFMPNNTLSREEAAVMISRAMNLKTQDNAKSFAALQKSFTDAGSINSNYSYGPILAVTKAKIMEGKANKLAEGEKKATYRFDPTATFSRAEAATIAVAIMNKMKLL